jgi:riboflavin synthase
MFTGIITDIGRVAAVQTAAGADRRLTIATAYDTAGIALGASIACSGVCLTVVAKAAGQFCVDVSGETIACTAPAAWRHGARLNLERALRVGDELGGHIVTGHVDGVGTLLESWRSAGSIGLRLLAPAALAPFIAAKGSITVDGVSLTVNAVADRDAGAAFDLNIIPHTAEWTTLADDLEPGRRCNLEIDLMARYLKRMRDTAHTGDTGHTAHTDYTGA